MTPNTARERERKMLQETGKLISRSRVIDKSDIRNCVRIYLLADIHHIQRESEYSSIAYTINSKTHTNIRRSHRIDGDGI